MNENLKAAREILIKNGYTCVLYSEEKEYYSSLRGVKPLLDFLESDKNFNGFCAADKTVGLGAAHLYVLLGVSSVWAGVMSSGARTLLERNGIDAFCREEAPFIINREGNGRCPIESAVANITDSTEALEAIKQTLKELQNKNHNDIW